MRGIHLLPLEKVVGLDAGDETVEKSGVNDGIEMDLVTHDARKFIGLMLRKNGYVLEQLLRIGRHWPRRSGRYLGWLVRIANVNHLMEIGQKVE